MTVSYTYDAMGRINVITYPSGLNVDYDYGALGDLSKIRAWSSCMSARDVFQSVETMASGPIEWFKYGNNEFTYDNMDRLDTGTGPDGSYDYDLNGNRNWHKLGGSTTNYNYTSSRARLLSRTGAMSETRSYDANGNTTRIGSQYFDHDAADRLWRYRYGSQTVTYAHSAFGERMLKTEGSTQTRFMYDGWRLVHERQGSTKRDYIYLDGEVVGFVKNNVLYYVHNDQIGRPEIITNASQTKVWEAENNAFGNAPLLDAIGGFNVGFAGQYYDQESGTYYNYFRTYDPSTGRYLQSDPIGIDGGLNTYSYSESNPVGLVDPHGLSAGVLESRAAIWAIRGIGGAACAVPVPGARVVGIGMIMATIPGDTPAEPPMGMAGNGTDSSDSGDDLSGTSAQPPDPEDEDFESRSVTFGENANQKRHMRRHLERENVSARDARKMILDDINSKRIGVGPIRGRVTVGGRAIEYRGQRFRDGSINIGRVTVQ